MNSKQLMIGIFIGVALMALVGGAYLLGSQSNNESTIETSSVFTNSTVTPTASLTPVENMDNVIETGIIEGSLNYPSEGIPDTLSVCALNTLTKETTCTTNHLSDSKYQYGVGYEISVVPGSYVVYATMPDSNYRAYYSEAVPCGLSVECTDHTPIILKLKSGEIATADPHDWYDTSQQ